MRLWRVLFGSLPLAAHAACDRSEFHVSSEEDKAPAFRDPTLRSAQGGATRHMGTIVAVLGYSWNLDGVGGI